MDAERAFPAVRGPVAAALLLLGAASAVAQDAAPRLDGDVGLAGLRSTSSLRGMDAAVSAIPYVWADYGRWFGRVDTFGLKTLDLGHGALEFVVRPGNDSYDPADSAALAGLAERRSSAWLGVGTFQHTPVGGLFAHLLRDFGASRGHWLDVAWSGRFQAGPATAYPSVGFDWLDANYTRYYYGARSADGAQPLGQAPYAPGSALRPKLGLMVDMPLAGDWHALASLRWRYLPGTLARSPMIDGRTESTALLAVAYRFK